MATSSLISIGCIQARVCHTGTCPVGITTQNEQLRKLFVHSKAVNRFVNFYNATNNELKVFARSNGVEDVHKLQLSDLVNDNKTVADLATLSMCDIISGKKIISGFSGGWVIECGIQKFSIFFQ